jgi:hypothetical protein
VPLRQRGRQPIPLRRPPAAAAAAAKRASSVSLPFFALSPPAEMDSIASPPTPSSVDGTSPLVYAKDFIDGGRWQGGGAMAGRWRYQGVGIGALLSEEGGGHDNQH